MNMNFGMWQKTITARRIGLAMILMAGVLSLVLNEAIHSHWWGLFLPWDDAGAFHAIIFLSVALLALGGGLTARIAGAVFLVILVIAAGIASVWGAIAQVSGLGYILGPFVGQFVPVLAWQYVILLLAAGGLFLCGNEK